MQKGGEKKVEMFETLERREKEELLDIYWNIIDNVWDRRIGRKPIGFDWLPDSSKRFGKKNKSSILKPYVKKIEDMTTPKERKKYLDVVIQKCMTEPEFEERWKLLESIH